MPEIPKHCQLLEHCSNKNPNRFKKLNSNPEVMREQIADAARQTFFLTVNFHHIQDCARIDPDSCIALQNSAAIAENFDVGNEGLIKKRTN